MTQGIRAILPSLPFNVKYVERTISFTGIHFLAILSAIPVRLDNVGKDHC